MCVYVQTSIVVIMRHWTVQFSPRSHEKCLCVPWEGIFIDNAQYYNRLHSIIYCEDRSSSFWDNWTRIVPFMSESPYSLTGCGNGVWLVVVSLCVKWYIFTLEKHNRLRMFLRLLLYFNSQEIIGSSTAKTPLLVSLIKRMMMRDYRTYSGICAIRQSRSTLGKTWAIFQLLCILRFGLVCSPSDRNICELRKPVNYEKFVT